MIRLCLIDGENYFHGVPGNMAFIWKNDVEALNDLWVVGPVNDEDSQGDAQKLIL